MTLFNLCRLATWIGRHTAHMAARTWDVVCGVVIALIAFAVLLLAMIALPRNREA